MKIAVVDDLKNERLEILHLVHAYFSNHSRQYQIEPNFDEFESGESFLSYFKPNTYDLIFLDIYMDQLTGIETAEKLLLLDRKCKIIFFTTSKEHALEGYGVHALSYVLKPINQHVTALYKALDHFIELLDVDRNGVTIKTNSGEQFVLYKNIMYIESSVRNLCVHFSSEVLKIQGTYSEYSKILLQDERFLESYRNLTVNMDFIQRPIDKDFILKTGEKIPISRRKKTEVLEKYTQYFINRRGY